MHIKHLFPVLLVCCSCAPAGNAASLEQPKLADGIVMVEYSGYAVGFDNSTRLPQWVAYELTRDEVKTKVTTRDGLAFQQDTRAGVRQADDSDYRNSGWSRGHLAPAADFRWSSKAMQETFLFTNCCPQQTDMNNGSWATLENRVRDWACEYGAVYVVTGPVIGNHENGYIGLNRIVIPDAFYKALLAKDAQGRYHAVAFVLHNIAGKQPYSECSMTVDSLEELLGLDFFPQLSDDVETAVEGVVDRRFWGL